MSNYTDKICPFCKTKFKEDDEIVVCSSCDMPHHKDCWIENQGCTTFGCMGTIKAVDGSVNTVTATEITYDEPKESTHVFCTKCGAQNDLAASFCGKCGNPMRRTYTAPVYQQNYHSQSVLNNQDIMTLVGTNQEYYIPRFQIMKSQNKKASWNWPAFFFTPYWFIYRKMYGYGFAFLGVMFLITLMRVPFFSLLALGGYISIGILANYIYMQWVEKIANQAKMMNEPFRTQYIQKNGGISSTALILTIVGYIFLSGLFLSM